MRTANLFKAVSIAAAAVLAVFLLQGPLGRAFHRSWHWTHYHYGNDLFTRRFFSGFLPVPVAFLLWLRQMGRTRELALSFSPVAFTLSSAGFSSAVLMWNHPRALEAAFAAGVMFGLFVFIPFAEWRRRACEEPALCGVALIAMTSAWDYYWLMGHSVSHAILGWTGEAVTRVLAATGVSVFVDENLDYPLAFDVISRHYRIILAPFCGGLEGVFLLLFLLSMLFLIDWAHLHFPGECVCHAARLSSLSAMA